MEMEGNKSKEQIIENLKNFIGRDIPEEIYDVVASAAQLHPGTPIIDMEACRHAAKITDNKNLVFWLAAQLRKREEILIVNRDKAGNPVMNTGHDWMSVQEIADYYMEDVKYIYDVLESVNFDLTSEQLQPELKNLEQKRGFYLVLSEKTGEIDLPVGEEVRKITLAQISEYLHIPFMDLYTRYQTSGVAAQAITDYSDSLRKRGENQAFTQVVDVEDFMFERELDLYHLLLFRADMKRKGMAHSIKMKEAYAFKKPEDYYILFLKDLKEAEHLKEYLTEEEYNYLSLTEEKIKEGVVLEGETLEQLLTLLKKKQITKKENTRLFCYLAKKEGLF